MKLSDAILKGMERFPKQNRNGYYFWHDDSACAIGCASWAIYGRDADGSVPQPFENACDAFFHAYGIHVTQANDKGIPREDIAGMLKAIGE